MSLTLYIKDLVVEAKHGVHPYEKAQAQRFGVTVELSLAYSSAVTSDDLDDTVDWSQLKSSIVSEVQNNSYNLIERLTQGVADKILTDKRIAKVVVIIEKLDAFESGVPSVKLEAEQSN